MSRYARKASLRESLGTLLVKRSYQLIQQNRADRHLTGRYRFRAAVRLVLEYIEWIYDASTTEGRSTEGDQVNVTVPLTERKRTEKKCLSLLDRSVLFTDPSIRSTSDKAQIMDILRELNAFRKYGDHLREPLAEVCLYRYFPAGRTIVRQGQPAKNLYFLIAGELALTRISVDHLTGDETASDIGLLQPGDTFGEIAMLHTVPRAATAVSRSSVDLLLIDCDGFDEVLRAPLTDDWNILRDALVHFNYFKTWDDSTIRECCIVSRVKDYDANEVVLGDGKGMVNYVHFLLEGECRLIEHINVRKQRSSRGQVRYQLDETTSSSTDRLTSETRRNLRGNGANGKSGNDVGINAETDAKWVPADGIDTSTDRERTTQDRISIITTTVIDIVNEWHEITGVAAMLMRVPSILSENGCRSNDAQTIFMQVCRFSRGSCFGLGEQMRDRRIVTTTPIRCLLIPRYWLFERNSANIWERVRIWMDSKYPTKRESFERFVRDRKWIEYREGLLSKIIDCRHGSFRTATIHDVPCSMKVKDV